MTRTNKFLPVRLLLTCFLLTTPWLTYAEDPAPAYEFASDFSNGFVGFNDELAENGGELTIIDDPTGAGMGKVLQGKITGEPEDWEFQIHPEQDISFQKFPCTIEQSFWISKPLYQNIQEVSRWFILFDIFDNNDWDNDLAHRSFNITLSDKGILRIGFHTNLDDEDEYTKSEPNAPVFKPETWHKVRIEASASGWISLFLDDQLVNQGKLIAPSQNGIAYIHGGPVLGPRTLARHSYVLVDDFKMTCW